MFKRLYWKLLEFPEGLVLGDRQWARARFWVALILIFIVVRWSGGFFFELNATNQVVQNWVRDYPVLLKFFSTPILRLPAVLFALGNIRYMLAPIAGIIGAVFIGARFLQDVYELPSYGSALSYLFAALFHITSYPHVTVADGKMQVKPGETNLLDVIGGPGYVRIKPGNVVLFERLQSPSNVRAAGSHFINRFEKIKDVIPLDEQDGNIEKAAAASKDGIEVTIQNIHFRYRLRPGPWRSNYAGRTMHQPYPYSVQAVRNRAYNRVVNPKGMTSWDNAVNLIVNDAITGFIQKNQLDHVTAPMFTGEDPRTTIGKDLLSKPFRDRFRDLGTELLWFDIGNFEIPEKKVDEQRFNAWLAKWTGNANVVRAYGDAQRLAYQELGRAEAQVEMLTSITYALNDAGLDENLTEQQRDQKVKQNIRNIILARTAQVLEAMTAIYNGPDTPSALETGKKL